MPFLASPSASAALARDARVSSDYAAILALRASYTNSRARAGLHVTPTRCRCGINTITLGDCVTCNAPA